MASLPSQPAVSIGNVGQLATDLLVSNLGLKLVGHIHDEDVLPVAGDDAYGVPGRVVTSIDGMHVACISGQDPGVPVDAPS